MGSKLIDRMRTEKNKAYQEGSLAGYEFALLVVTLALNRTYHFGRDRLRDRLKVVEAECNRIVEEEFGRDMELAGARLRRAVDKIMEDMNEDRIMGASKQRNA